MAKVTDAPAQAAPQHALISTLIAEAFGTLVLVTGVIGAAIFGGDYLGIALAIGLSVIIGIYTVGHISGGHFNPAVTVGLALAGRFGWSRVLPYIGAQIVGGVIGSSILFLIATGGPDGFAKTASENGFASNGFGDHSSGHFGLIAVILTEIVLTALFLYVILGVTDSRNSVPIAPIVIGVTLTVIHLIAIPISGASVNPARSIATAIYGGTGALSQLIVFIIAPLLGAALAGLTYKFVFARAK